MEALVSAGFAYIITIATRVLAQVVGLCRSLEHMIRAGDTFGKALRPSCDLAHVVMGRLLILLPQLLEKRMLQDL